MPEIELGHNERQLIRAFLEKNKPYLLALEKMVQEIKFGQLTVTLRIHQGFVTDLVNATAYERKKFVHKDDQEYPDLVD